MLRIVLIVAAGCVLLVAVLALTRGGGRPALTAGEPPEPAPSVEQAAKPAAAKAPEPKAEPAPAAPELPVDQQVEDDAAAVGMTTREPKTPDEPPAEPER